MALEQTMVVDQTMALEVVSRLGHDDVSDAVDNDC